MLPPDPANASYRLDPDVILLMHYTGTPFIERLREHMPQKAAYSNVWSRFTFAS